MKFKIGSLEVETAPAIEDATFEKFLSSQPGLIGRKPRHVYYWDCALEPGGNPIKPKYFVVEANLSVAVLTANGAVNSTASRQVLARLQQAAGAANVPALDAQLAASFPPLIVTIPWANIDDYFTNRNRVQVIAWVGYKDMLLKPTAGPQQDTYILSYPNAVRFVAVVAGKCGLQLKPGGVLIPQPDKVKTVTIGAPNGPPKDFGTEYDTDLRARVLEDPDRMRRLRARRKSAADRRQRRYQDSIAYDDDDW